jgi:hypothetical protein
MKLRLLPLLIGLIGLSFSAVVMAHGPGGSYGSYGPSGSVSVWGDSYGQFGYAGTLSYGAGYGWVAPPFPGHVHGRACGNAPRHYGAYGKGYRHGYRHGRWNGRKNGHGRGHKHGRH